ncbi:MAG: hypothetical protein Q7T04_00760 [Dehalococcoidia bacterium]|nr:hypothetical protein [Dehalococcoidia bacterium]
MTDEKEEKKEQQPVEEPYPDLATALHGEYILFRNERIAPPPQAGKKEMPEAKQGKPEKDGKPQDTGA